MNEKLEPGDVIILGNGYFVYIGFDMNAFQFYGVGDQRFRVMKDDVYKLDGLTIVGKIKPGRGIRKRFTDFLSTIEEGK